MQARQCDMAYAFTNARWTTQIARNNCVLGLQTHICIRLDDNADYKSDSTTRSIETPRRTTMGCDIHLHSEIKVGGIWHHYSQPRLRRDYELFARMANVRNDGSIKPISEPRGLPLDVSYTTKVVSDYEQGHSHSWLSSEEIGALVEEVSKRRAGEDGIGYYSWEHRELGYLFGNDWDFKKYPLEDGSGYSGQPKWLEDVRFVFWFDS